MNNKSTQSNLISEITINYSLPPDYNKATTIKGAKDAFEEFKTLWANDIEYKERVYLLCLNQVNKVIGYSVVGIGSVNACVFDIKQILQTALKTNSTGIIIAHNHPSKTLIPSESDKNTTKKLAEACKTMDIRLLDHLIISKEEYFSFEEDFLL